MEAKERQLTQAIIDKNLDSVDLLLKDSNINEWINNPVATSDLQLNPPTTHIEWTTPMCHSCQLSDVATVKKLVGAGARLYHVNGIGHTALIRTCLGKTEDTLEKVKLLVDKDERLVHATDNRGFSALHTASRKGHADVCDYLLNAGANVNAENDQGATSLHLAAHFNHTAVIETLHRHRADLRQRTKTNNEPLHNAALGGAYEALKLLIILGADTYSLGQWKRSALHLAAESGSVTCIKALIDRGVPVDVRDEDNVTPLHMAAKNDHVQCIHVLVTDYGADVNAQTDTSCTPLHWACEDGKLSAVEALVSFPDCDIYMKNKEGKTARELAAANNHQHITALLSQTPSESTHLEEVHRELSAVKREVEALKEERDATVADSASSMPFEHVQRELSVMKREITVLKERDAAAAQGIGAMSISDDSKLSAMELKRSVRRHMHWLVRNIEAMPHVDYLYSHEALNEEDYQNIVAVRTEAGKVRTLIMTLMEKPNESWAPVFLESLQEECSFAAERILGQ